MSTSQLPRDRRISLAVVVGVASALGLFSTFEAYYYVALFTRESPSFPMLMGLNFTYWWAWAALVPGVVWMARRFRFGRQTWPRSLAAHAAGVFTFTLAHSVITVTCRTVILGAFDKEGTGWMREFQRLFLMNFDWEMMTYWAIVGVSHALDFHRESQERALTAAHLEASLAQARLQALQRQLHPHFLFNTLHTISALMHIDAGAADAMLARLSDLLRLTLQRIMVQEVTLREELEFIAKYLEIEQKRFGDRLRVQTSIEPETLDAMVPSFLLQPLVENAIRHGIAPKIGGGIVQIVSRRDGRKLLLTIRDDGAGLSATTRDALTTGVGISNTRTRLQHLYGEAHRFDLLTPAGGGLAVVTVIPFTIQAEQSRPMESVA